MMKKIVALASAGLVLLLSGCTNVNAAATLDGDRVTVAQVQTAVNQIMEERKTFDTSQMNLPAGEDLNRNELTFFVVSAMLKDIAKHLKVEVTEKEVTAAVNGVVASVGGKQNLPQALVQANIPSGDLDTYFRMYLTSKKLQTTLKAAGVPDAQLQEAFTKLISDSAIRLHLVINPRYGKWDAATGNIVAADLASGAVTKK